MSAEFGAVDRYAGRMKEKSRLLGRPDLPNHLVLEMYIARVPIYDKKV